VNSKTNFSQNFTLCVCDNFLPLLESVDFKTLKRKENLVRNTKKWVLAKDEDEM